MAFIECPECGKEIPDIHKHCIFCGSRIYFDTEMVRPVETRKENLDTEGAGKDYKFLKLIGVSIVIIGSLVFLLTWLGSR